MKKLQTLQWFSVIAALCLAVVCAFLVGCEGIAMKPAAERLGPHELDSEGFITSWLVVGSFPNPGERPDNKGFHVDYLKNYSREAKHVPASGMEIAKEDGEIVVWEQYESPYSVIDFFSVDHLDLDYEEEDILTYSACWLEAEKDMNVEFRLGSDDGYKLWLDHKLIGEEHVYRSAIRDEETYDVKLTKGMHLVLIKVDQDWGNYEFMMRVVTSDGEKAEGIKVWN